MTTVSVVIPSWNGRALLDLSLASLERQTKAPLETIVVDNGDASGGSTSSPPGASRHILVSGPVAPSAAFRRARALE